MPHSAPPHPDPPPAETAYTRVSAHERSDRNRQQPISIGGREQKRRAKFDSPAGGGTLTDRLAAAGGLVHLAAAGETSWHGFAAAIVAGLRERGVTLAVARIAPIATADYPTKAKRPANSRLDLTRLESAFGIRTPRWNAALAVELDRLARELANSAIP